MTPVKKIIHFYKNLPNPNPIVLEALQSILIEEKEYLRDVADKAFQEGYQHESFDTYKNKEEYLNQNHPL